jgi:hypothetical protein
VRYETVEGIEGRGLKPRVIEQEGPTGLLVTTTLPSLDAEIETRLLSIPIDDSPEQTHRIMLAAACPAGARQQADLGLWYAFQEWLGLGSREVSLLFAEALAEMIPETAGLRLRRDFPALLKLIQAHALIHRANREYDAQGQVIATIEDYSAVHELVADLIAEGVRAAVSPALRATVEAVRAVIAEKSHVHKVAVDMINMDVVSASLAEVAKAMDRDKGTASRRIKEAIEAGYIVNRETKPGLPARLVPGDATPSQGQVLPTPEALRERCCGVAPL